MALRECKTRSSRCVRRAWYIRIFTVAPIFERVHRYIKCTCYSFLSLSLSLYLSRWGNFPWVNSGRLWRGSDARYLATRVKGREGRLRASRSSARIWQQQDLSMSGSRIWILPLLASTMISRKRNAKTQETDRGWERVNERRKGWEHVGERGSSGVNSASSWKSSGIHADKQWPRSLWTVVVHCRISDYLHLLACNRSRFRERLARAKATKLRFFYKCARFLNVALSLSLRLFLSCQDGF